MMGSDPPEFADGGALTSVSVDSFLEAKLHRPPTRAEWVDRPRLWDLLDRAAARPISLVAAPAGFGKTTLVAQWLNRRRPGSAAAAWVSVDAGDNDPGRLWSHTATALERAGVPLGHDVSTFMAAAHSGEVITGVLPRLLNAMAAMPGEVLLVFDDFQFVHEPACHDQVEFLVEHLPPQAHLLITTRADPGLRLGRLRAAGQLAEVRAADLAFNDDEAAALLALQDVRLTATAMALLMQRTEGWPAGLYLATLSLSGRSDPDEVVRQLSGDNRFIGDYLTEEVLNRHSHDVREFIMAMSIVDRFSASLCDAVVETTGSAGLLHDLERTNMFLVPLDEQRHWFRFHHLFAAVARAELEVEHPDRVADLHRRAAAWFREHSNTDEAVTHLLAAGATSEAALLVEANWLTYVDAGRTATVLGWLDALGTPSVANDPAAGVMAAWMASLAGDQEALAAHLAALAPFSDFGPLPDGTRSVESAVAMIQGLFGYGGPVEMAAGARRAVEIETDGRSPYYAIANFTLGHAAYVEGDLDLAASMLIRSSNNDSAPAIIRLLSLSVHSLVEAERGQHDRSRELAELAMEIFEDNSLQSMPQASPALSALAQAQATAGKLADALASVEQGLALRRRNPTQGPWGVLFHLMVSARVAVEAGELPMARDLIDDISNRMDQFTEGMGPMRARLAAIQESLRLRTAAPEAGEPLTGRELDVLKLLPRSLSLTEIAGELFVSPNTVKTHTQSLYRKLGARSRTEAVRIARQRLLI